MALGAYDFYVAQATTNDWVEVPFLDENGDLFLAYAQRVINTTANEALISYNGTDTHGDLGDKESIEFNRRQRGSIWVKSKAAGTPTTLKIYAW